jgi:thiamine transport system permease protein
MKLAPEPTPLNSRPGDLPRAATRPAFHRKPAWRALVLWLVPLLFLGFFFFYPLFTIFKLSFSPEYAQPGSPILWLDLWRPFSFTLAQALASTALTLLVGLPAAYLFARIRFPGKGFLRVATTLPFILPTVVVAVGFNALLGPRGWVNLGLMSLFHLANPPVQFLNTLWAILLAHIFYNTTIVTRMVGDAWGRLDPHLEQAAQALGANRWRVFWEVTLPLLRPVILAASLLVFIFDFTSFGVILILGGPHFATLEVSIYIQALQMLNLPLAGVLSLIQLLCTLAMTIAYSRLGGQTFIPLSPRGRLSSERPMRGWLEKGVMGAFLAFLAALLISPLAALVLRSFTRLAADRAQLGPVTPGLTLAYYQELFINRQGSLFYVPPVDAARNSLVYAGVTVLISLTLGFLAAYALRQPSRLNRWLDPLLMLPLGTSPVTLGLGFIVAFSVPPVDFRSMPWLLPAAYSLVALPFVVRTVQPALASIPHNLRQSAAVLGASPWRVWREIDLPIVARAGLVSATFAFTIALGEFGASSFLARPEYPTLPVAIYRFLSLPGDLNYGQALAMSTVLMLICAAGIALIERLRLPGEGPF